MLMFICLSYAHCFFNCVIRLMLFCDPCGSLGMLSVLTDAVLTNNTLTINTFVSIISSLGDTEDNVHQSTNTLANYQYDAYMISVTDGKTVRNTDRVGGGLKCRNILSAFIHRFIQALLSLLFITNEANQYENLMRGSG